MNKLKKHTYIILLSSVIVFATNSAESNTVSVSDALFYDSFEVSANIENNSVCPNMKKGYCRPYDESSPWNTPIPKNVKVHPKSQIFIKAIADNNKPLTSDPDQYTIPIYLFDEKTPRVSVQLSGYFSTFEKGDDDRKGHGEKPLIKNVPMPKNAKPSKGSDGQIVLWDPVNDIEYAFFRFKVNNDGSYSAENGWKSRTGKGFNGRFSGGKSGRGAGTTYFAGLVRPWEIEQGKIEHALAFAYKYPAKTFVYPASKSDGKGVEGVDLPEGSLLQLNPNLTEKDFDRWGLSREAKIIARALQKYGMYTIDCSGSSKVYIEDNLTANWNNKLTRSTLSDIPWSAFRVVDKTARSTNPNPNPIKTELPLRTVGVFVGPAPKAVNTGIPNFEKDFGVKVAVASDYAKQTHWHELEGDTEIFKYWGDSTYLLEYSFSMFPKGKGSLVSCAEGDYNKTWQKLGENLVKAGLEDTFLRPGKQSYVDWQPHRVERDPESYKHCFRQIVKTMKKVKGNSFSFVWSVPIIGLTNFDAKKAWPGGFFVDYIGVNVYDMSDSSSTYPYASSDVKSSDSINRQKRVLDLLINGQSGLNNWYKFAKSVQAKFAISEWGVSLRRDNYGGGDNDIFINGMANWIKSHDVSYHIYKNAKSAHGNHLISDRSKFNHAAIAFRDSFESTKLKNSLVPKEVVTNGFKHPGIVLNVDDIEALTKVSSGSGDTNKAKKSVLNFMLDHNYGVNSSSRGYKRAKLLDYPVKLSSYRVDCASIPKDISCEKIREDALVAYSAALAYYATGDERYAKKSITLLNYYSKNNVRIRRSNENDLRGSDNDLFTAWMGEMFPKAGELMRYSGQWNENDAEKFGQWLNKTILPMVEKAWFDPGNWSSSMVNATINIGIYNSDSKVFNEGIALWKETIKSAIYLNSDGDEPIPFKGRQSKPKKYSWWGMKKFNFDGSIFETCRDLAHPLYSVNSFTESGKSAYYQGVDLLKLEKKRLVAAHNFTAYLLNKYSGNGKNKTGNEYTVTLNGDEKGLCSKTTLKMQNQAAWEMGYAHYHGKLGIEMEHTKKRILENRKLAITTNVPLQYNILANHFQSAWPILTHGIETP